MKNEKRASTAGTVKGSRKAERPVRCAHLYCITWMMAIATIASGWHIEGAWDGIATMIMAIVTVYLVQEVANDWEADS